MNTYFTALLWLVFIFVYLIHPKETVNILPSVYSLNVIYKVLSYVSIIIVPNITIKYLMRILTLKRDKKNIIGYILIVAILIPSLIFIRAEYVSFEQVIGYLIAIIVLIVNSTNLILVFLTEKKSDIIFGILLFVMLHLNILLIFGSYNMAHSQLPIKLISSQKTIIQLYYGSKYVFNFPNNPTLAENIIPYMQFLFWHLYNLIIVGFFAAYFMNAISNIGKNDNLAKCNNISEIDKQHKSTEFETNNVPNKLTE